MARDSRKPSPDPVKKLSTTGTKIYPGHSRSKNGPLQSQQIVLDFQAAAITAEMAVAANDAMTGNNDGQGIGAIGAADGTDGVGIAQFFGNLQISDRLAVGNLFDQRPHLLLKRRAFYQVDGLMKMDDLSRQVQIQVVNQRIEKRFVLYQHRMILRFESLDGLLKF